MNLFSGSKGLPQSQELRICQIDSGPSPNPNNSISEITGLEAWEVIEIA